MQSFQYVIRNVLEAADTTGSQSLAIPPIGTGNVGYPPHLVARTICREVDIFANAHPRSRLIAVYLVILPSDSSLQQAS
jgi:O-acetyl-ADP-ribose deacetylase (regulator of RNase III)